LVYDRQFAEQQWSQPGNPRLPQDFWQNLAADWTRRVVAGTEEVTYFGANSVMAAFAQATAEQAVLVGNADFLQGRDVAVPPPVRKHRVERLEDLLALANFAAATSPIIYHNAHSVELLLNDADRRDRVTFTLTPSAAFEAVAKLEQKGSLDQRALVRLLGRTLGVGKHYVDRFRRIDFKLANEGTQVIERAKETLGKRVEAQVQGVDELPDEIDVTIPLYREIDEQQTYSLRLFIEPDLRNQVFEVGPFPGEVDRVQQLPRPALEHPVQPGGGDIKGHRQVTGLHQRRGGEARARGGGAAAGAGGQIDRGGHADTFAEVAPLAAEADPSSLSQQAARVALAAISTGRSRWQRSCACGQRGW
jgi:hypothetical protein